MKNRLIREEKTLELMISIYCTKNHKQRNILCSECRELLAYAVSKLNKCVFKETKPVCAKCVVHCYKQEMRNQVRKVMRYSGKRMLFRHPIMTIRHLIDMLNYRSNTALH